MHIALVSRHDYADGLDLIDRCVRGIKQTRVTVEVNVAFDPFLQLRLDFEIVSTWIRAHHAPVSRRSLAILELLNLDPLNDFNRTVTPKRRPGPAPPLDRFSL